MTGAELELSVEQEHLDRTVEAFEQALAELKSRHSAGGIDEAVRALAHLLSGFQEARAGNRTPLSTHGAGAPSMRSASANTDQVHDEHERLVGADRPAGPALTVSEHRRDRDPPTTADPHPGHTLIPPGDHLALTQTKLEGAATVPRRVELLARLPRDADVMHLDHAPRDGLITVSDHDVFDLKLIRRRLIRRHRHIRLLTDRHDANLAIRASAPQPA
jgi:hypothetical protein